MSTGTRIIGYPPKVLNIIIVLDWSTSGVGGNHHHYNTEPDLAVLLLECTEDPRDAVAGDAFGRRYIYISESRSFESMCWSQAPPAFRCYIRIICQHCGLEVGRVRYEDMAECGSTYGIEYGPVFSEV